MTCNFSYKWHEQPSVYMNINFVSQSYNFSYIWRSFFVSFQEVKVEWINKLNKNLIDMLSKFSELSMKLQEYRIENQQFSSNEQKRKRN